MPDDLLEYLANDDDAGQRLDKWLAHVTELSRSRVQALMSDNAVYANNRPVSSASTKVQAQTVYSVKIPAPVPATPLAENIPLDIVYEDKGLLVVNKSPGMTVHPAPGSVSGTLVNALLYHAKDSLSGIGGVLRPGIVHRIDKDTSGLLVVAKTDHTHQHLSAQFARHSVDRTYICFVRGKPKPREGRFESRLARSPHNRKKQAVVKETWGNMEASEHGRHAITNYRTLNGYGQMPKSAVGTPLVSVIECKLETGRTHQIRVHLAHHGCPLLGDPLYGKQRAFKTTKNVQEIKLNDFLKGFKRQALHAKTLGFIHPVSKEQLEFSSSLPPDLSDLTDHLSALNSG